MWGNAGSGGFRTASLGDALASCAAHASEKKSRSRPARVGLCQPGHDREQGTSLFCRVRDRRVCNPCWSSARTFPLFRLHSEEGSIRGFHEPNRSREAHVLSLLEKATPRGDVPRGAFVYLRSEPQSCARPAPEGAFSRAMMVIETGHALAPVRRTQRPLGLVLHAEQGFSYFALRYGSKVPCVQPHVEAPFVVELVGIASMGMAVQVDDVVGHTGCVLA